MFTSGVSPPNQSSLYPTQSTGAANTKKSSSTSFTVSDGFMDAKTEGMAHILEKVETDERFAREMIEHYRNTPDRPMFNLEEALSTPDGLAQLQSRTNQFNEVAHVVSAQREELINSMRAENQDDASIFKALMEFNNSLPYEYKQIAGIVKVDTQA